MYWPRTDKTVIIYVGAEGPWKIKMPEPSFSSWEYSDADNLVGMRGDGADWDYNDQYFTVDGKFKERGTHRFIFHSYNFLQILSKEFFLKIVVEDFIFVTEGNNTDRDFVKGREILFNVNISGGQPPYKNLNDGQSAIVFNNNTNLFMPPSDSPVEFVSANISDSLDQGRYRDTLLSLTHVDTSIIGPPPKNANGQLVSGFNDFRLDLVPWISIVTEVSFSLPLDHEFKETVVAEGGRSPYTYKVDGDMPPGLKFTSDGKFTGTPTTPGRYSFYVGATDSDNIGGKLIKTAFDRHRNGWGQFTILIEKAERAKPYLYITSADHLFSGVQGQPWAFQFNAFTNEKSYTFSTSQDDAIFPLGMTLSSNGLLSGTPMRAGDYYIIIKITGESGTYSTKTFTWHVTPPLTVDISGPTSREIGQTYLGTLTASGGILPYTYKAYNLPTDLKIDGNHISGRIKGTTNFTIEAQDARGHTVTKGIALTVTPTQKTYNLKFNNVKLSIVKTPTAPDQYYHHVVAEGTVTAAPEVTKLEIADSWSNPRNLTWQPATLDPKTKLWKFSAKTPRDDLVNPVNCMLYARVNGDEQISLSDHFIFSEPYGLVDIEIKINGEVVRAVERQQSYESSKFDIASLVRPGQSNELLIRIYPKVGLERLNVHVAPVKFSSKSLSLIKLSAVGELPLFPTNTLRYKWDGENHTQLLSAHGLSPDNGGEAHFYFVIGTEELRQGAAITISLSDPDGVGEKVLSAFRDSANYIVQLGGSHMPNE